MSLQVIDAGLMQRAFLAGAKGLEAKKEWINELNVFPVPDGDTGTNMTMTIMAAAKEVASMEEPTIDGLAKAISSGSLRGARGNSGVILSQLFRGFAKEIKGHETIDVDVLAASFNRAAETAYKAVMKPKEGTILTVARGMADKALEVAEQTEDILGFAAKVSFKARFVLSYTEILLNVSFALAATPIKPRQSVTLPSVYGNAISLFKTSLPSAVTVTSSAFRITLKL